MAQMSDYSRKVMEELLSKMTQDPWKQEVLFVHPSVRERFVKKGLDTANLPAGFIHYDPGIPIVENPFLNPGEIRKGFIPRQEFKPKFDRDEFPRPNEDLLFSPYQYRYGLDRLVYGQKDFSVAIRFSKVNPNWSATWDDWRNWEHYNWNWVGRLVTRLVALVRRVKKAS